MTLPSAPGAAAASTIYVDLDGTLLRSDLLFESLTGLLRKHPAFVLWLPIWLLRGRAYLKSRIAEFGPVEVASLPYRTELLDYLKQKARLGHRIVLATASNEKCAAAVAAHLRIFDAVLASSAETNLKGQRKALAIIADAAGTPFWYAGNDSSDLKVWARSHGAILVNVPEAVRARAGTVSRVEHEFPREAPTLKQYVRAIRAYQWSKNLLVFVALVAAHLMNRLELFVNAVFAFLAFSLTASSIYLLNDLLDLPSDRQHPRKRTRPLAAGNIPIAHAMLLIPVLLVAGFSLAALLGRDFVIALGLYVAITCAYSFKLKKFALIDVGVLAALYTSRVIGGAIAIAVLPSFWLLAFSGFLFLSLALIKRCSELMTLPGINRTAAPGRDYGMSDLHVLSSIGIASGFGAVLVLALYVNSDAVVSQYQSPYFLWLLCATVLYWMARMWLKTARGEMHDDPLIYAVRDRGSLVMIALSIFIIITAIVID